MLCGQCSIVEFAAPVARHKEPRGEIAVIDPEARRAPQHRLAPVGDAQAGALHHGEIVGAVADRAGGRERQAAPGRQLGERIALGLAAEDRLRDRAVQAICLDDQAIGARLVEALLPSGEVTMSVQLSPSWVDSTSMRLPLLLTPVAIGASLYFSASNSTVLSR